MAVAYFTSSDMFMFSDPKAAEYAEVDVIDYIEGTFYDLRTGPDGNVIAQFRDGAWELPDGRRFSDWAVAVKSKEE